MVVFNYSSVPWVLKSHWISRAFLPPFSHGEKSGKFQKPVKTAHMAVVLIFLSFKKYIWPSQSWHHLSFNDAFFVVAKSLSFSLSPLRLAMGHCSFVGNHLVALLEIIKKVQSGNPTESNYFLSKWSRNCLRAFFAMSFCENPRIFGVFCEFFWLLSMSQNVFLISTFSYCYVRSLVKPLVRWPARTSN